MSQREDLLQGAKRCLIEKGYRQTTARDIATAAGSHLASIGYHFGSKDELMRQAALEATSEWGDAVEAAARAAQADDPPRRLTALLEQLFAAIPESRPLNVAGGQTLAESMFDPKLRAALATEYRTARRALASVVLDDEEAEIDEPTERGLGSLVLALTLGYVVQAMIDPDLSPTADEAAAALRAVSPPPEPAD